MHGKPVGLVGLVALAPRPAVTAALDRSEPELLEAARRGDRDAWGTLIERHDHRVVVSLLGRGLRLDHARELAQQTWTRLIAQQQGGRLDRLELPGLAIRQAGFLAADLARRRAAELVDREAPGDAVADPDAGIEERLIRREELARAEAELARCAPVARQVFALLYAEPGLRHAEVARRLGLSVQRVRQTLCEVRARLRAAIEPEP